MLKDGKIFLQGPTYVRLTANGTVDTTFGGGDGIASSYLAGDRRDGGVNTNAVLSDGSYFELSNTRDGQGRLYKYKADGSVDKSFGSSGSYNLANLPMVNEKYVFSPDTDGAKTGTLSNLGGLTVDAQGRVYISYEVTFPNDAFGSVALTRVARLTAMGKLDAGFGDNGVYAESGGFDEFSPTDLGDAIAVTADGRLLVEQRYSSDHSLSQDYVDVFSPDGELTDSVGSSDSSFRMTKIVPAKDGSVYLVGTTYDAADDDFDGDLYGPTYASVAHLTKDLRTDTSYSADHDGVAGFRFNDAVPNVRALDGALTPSGDFIELGDSGFSIGLVKFEGPTKATRTTYSVSNGQLIVNGSAADDHISAANVNEDPYYNGNALVVRLDDYSLGVSSEDKLVFVGNTDGTSPITRFVVNLNGGDDRFDGSKLNRSVYVNAGSGNDSVVGGIANDTLYGGDGTDTLVGGGGVDKITQ